MVRWVSDAANSDPLLAPSLPQERTVSAARKVSGRPLTAPKASAKGAAADEGEETTALMNFVIPRPPTTADPKRLPLWAPISIKSLISKTDYRDDICSCSFESNVSAEYIIHIAAAVAATQVLHSCDDSLPIVRFVEQDAHSCPEERTLFSEAIENFLLTVKSENQNGKRELIESLHIALASVTSLLTEKLRCPKVLAFGRIALQQGLLSPDSNIKSPGHCLCPADITLVKAVTSPLSFLRLRWACVSNIMGHESRFHVSYVSVTDHLFSITVLSSANEGATCNKVAMVMKNSINFLNALLQYQVKNDVSEE
jgi:hypothetical protein